MFNSNAEAPLEWSSMGDTPFQEDGVTIRKVTRDSAGNTLRADVIPLRKEDLPALKQVVAALEGKSLLGIAAAGLPPAKPLAEQLREDFELCGSSFLWIVRDEVGRISEVNRLDPAKVMPMLDGRWRVIEGDRSVFLAPGTVAIVRMPNLPRIAEAGALVDRKMDDLRSLVKTGSITVDELRAQLDLPPLPDPEKGGRFVDCVVCQCVPDADCRRASERDDAELAKPFVLESRVDSPDLSAEEVARIRNEFEEAHRGKVNLITLPPGMELKRIDDGADDLIEYAWGIIANAHGGDWSKASADWRVAAIKWRDRYHERRSAQAKEFAVKKDHEVLASVRDAEFTHRVQNAPITDARACLSCGRFTCAGCKQSCEPVVIVPIPYPSVDIDYRHARDRIETCVGSAACARCLNVVCQCVPDADCRRASERDDADARAHQAAFGTPGLKLVADPDTEELRQLLAEKVEQWRDDAIPMPPIGRIVYPKPLAESVIYWMGENSPQPPEIVTDPSEPAPEPDHTVNFREFL